ncbi:hypothetical protein VNO77_43803 [Canavalia gladiata]|uniref:Uncharacterized protein n=1 Tax=Canavalia gladiata TaxID=3824 RepID=A0AAN9JWV8_CANGL
MVKHNLSKAEVEGSSPFFHSWLHRLMATSIVGIASGSNSSFHGLPTTLLGRSINNGKVISLPIHFLIPHFTNSLILIHSRHESSSFHEKGWFTICIPPPIVVTQDA